MRDFVILRIRLLVGINLNDGMAKAVRLVRKIVGAGERTDRTGCSFWIKDFWIKDKGLKEIMS